jgi:citrate lyase subunit beta/citryl-CoA lyase
LILDRANRAKGPVVLTSDGLATARTLLFVPGDRPDRFRKAAASGADAVVLDLEDAVAPDRKDEARGHVAAWLEAGHDAVVRINAVGTLWHGADIEALVDILGGHAHAVMLSKTEHPGQVTAVLGSLPAGSYMIPLIETAAGVLGARAICEARGVVRPAFGHIDLAAQLGVSPDARAALVTARSTLVLAAAAADCAPPLDGVTTSIGDQALLLADIWHAVELGFTGKLCIHPSQVAAVHAALVPTAAELAWAREVLAVSGDGSAVAHNGQMIDRPVLLRAQRLVELAKRTA